MFSITLCRSVSKPAKFVNEIDKNVSEPYVLVSLRENMIITSQENANGINRNISNTVYADIPFFNLVMPNSPDSFAIITAVIECSQDGLNEASLKIFDNASFKGTPKTYKQTVANAKVIITLGKNIPPSWPDSLRPSEKSYWSSNGLRLA